jgi:radical SAM superfamily enzyme YgiQ (UPF0313 family)
LNTPYFPLGLLYLAAFLREEGYAVDIFDGTFKSGIDDFAADLKARRPAVVGISVVSPNRQLALQLAKTAKENNAAVILGGPDPTRFPENYLTHLEVDFVVHHEGELTLVELLGNLLGSKVVPELSTIAGIAYRDGDQRIQVNPRRSFILDLDKLPLPARDMIDLDQYFEFWREHNGYASLTVSVARGCPYGCEWCQEAVHGPQMRLRSPQSVAAEVKTLQEMYEFDRLRVVDDVDGLQREWIEEWAEIAQSEGAYIPFEALNDLDRKDIPMLDVRDTL